MQVFAKWISCLITVLVIAGCSTDSEAMNLGILGLSSSGLEDSAFQSMKFPEKASTWQVLDKTGGGAQTTPYLSSLGMGEGATGWILSPTFTVKDPVIKFYTLGYDGQDGTQNENMFQLVEEGTGEVLTSAKPGQGESAKWVEMDVSQFKGKQVQIKCLDNRAHGGFAWFGVEKIEGGESFNADFAKDGSLEGWTKDVSSGRDETKLDGVPYIKHMPMQKLNEIGSVWFEPAAKVKRMYLFGMKNTIDMLDENGKIKEGFEPGARLGEIRVIYADSFEDVYQLIVGRNVWYEKMPFIPISSMDLEKIVSPLLEVYNLNNENADYMAVIKFRSTEVLHVDFVDAFKKEGSVGISGVTFETDSDAGLKIGEAVKADKISPETKKFILTREIKPEELVGRGEAKKLQQISELVK